MVFQIVMENNVMKNIKDIKFRDQELLNNPLYNIFVVNPVIHKKIEMKIKKNILLETTTVIEIIKIPTLTITTEIEITIDIEAIVEIIHKIITDLLLDKDFTIDLQVHTPYRNNTIYRCKSGSRYRSRSQSQGNSFKRYIYPYRSPPRPRDYRSRSRTPSQNRQQNIINRVDVKSTNDKYSTKFEIHTCQITEIASTITPYSWFYPLYVHASEGKDNILPSKIEILFLLDTGASILVLNLPTFHVIAKQLNLNVPKNIENKRAKTLTVANQTEVPIIHYISMTCFTGVNHQNRSLNIEFAVANNKCNNLRTPFLKKNIQNIDFH